LEWGGVNLSHGLMIDAKSMTVVAGGFGGTTSAETVIASEVPDLLAKLSPKERKAWDYITAALRDYGLIHRTDAILLTVIVRTFARWVDAEEQLSAYAKEHDGSYIIKTPNGFEQPHQLFYLARTLKRELLQWLPEAALTIPSFSKQVGERARPEQGSLFEDPVTAHRERRAAMGLRAVK